MGLKVQGLLFCLGFRACGLGLIRLEEVQGLRIQGFRFVGCPGAAPHGLLWSLAKSFLVVLGEYIGVMKVNGN